MRAQYCCGRECHTVPGSLRPHSTEKPQKKHLTRSSKRPTPPCPATPIQQHVDLQHFIAHSKRSLVCIAKKASFDCKQGFFTSQTRLVCNTNLSCPKNEHERDRKKRQNIHFVMQKDLHTLQKTINFVIVILNTIFLP